MTSIPASRSARAMIFAPRSWPSRPGFATTTLIFPATVGQYRNGEAHRRRLLPRVAEPRPRPLRVPVRGERRATARRLRPGVLSRLREAEGWPTVDAIAITHMHLDHYGDLVAWLWGHLHVPPRGTVGPELWLPPGGREELERMASRFDEVFRI